ncbi:insulinase family protein [Patescibacteria group bacterium]|nr:insulinase family protein [Patescibacteria group bacterium]
MSTPYSVSTAANGIQILKVPRAGTEAATVSFLFRGGSRYETKETNGLAHFNEHMVFKGGKEYPNFTAVTHAFDKIGAISNAFTGAEVTGFWGKVRSAHIIDVADVFSDVLTGAHYDKKELDRERGVIIEEINMYEDDPQSTVMMMLEEVTFPKHPLGRSTLGPKANIKRFTPNDFRKYDSVHQTPDRMVLVIAGNLDGLDQPALDEKLARFSGSSDVQPEPFTVTQTKPVFRLKKKPTEQTHLGIAIRSIGMKDEKKSVILGVLAQILGGTMSSRLFVEVREKQGLAYTVRAIPDQNVDVGNLVVYAGLRHEKASKALAAILKEVKRLADGDISDDELNMHKDSVMGRLALRWEDSMALADFYGEQQLLLGKMTTTEEELKKIAAVSKDDVVQLANELTDDAKLNAAVIGPHEAKTFESELSFG